MRQIVFGLEERRCQVEVAVERQYAQLRILPYRFGKVACRIGQRQLLSPPFTMFPVPLPQRVVVEYAIRILRLDVQVLRKMLVQRGNVGA